MNNSTVSVMHNIMTKTLMVAALAAGMTMRAEASVWSGIAKGYEKAFPKTAEKAAVKAGGKVVGTTAWSGYDLYKAAKALPRELSQVLERTVDACAAQSSAEATELAERLVKIYTEGKH